MTDIRSIKEMIESCGAAGAKVLNNEAGGEQYISCNACGLQ
jgi:hypothetical protein